MRDLSVADGIVDELDTVLDTVESLDETGWSRPTRCPPWTVLELVAHLVNPPRALANGLMALREGHESSQGGEPLPAGVPVPAVLQALRERRDQVAAELSRLKPAELDAVLPPPVDNPLSLPLSTLLRLALVEIGIHRSDLCAALGLPDGLSDVVISAVADVVPTWLLFEGPDAPNPEARFAYHLAGDQLDVWFSYHPAEGWSLQQPDQPANSTISGADSNLALLLLGRRSPDHPTLSTDVPAALRAFKTHLPGPT